MNNYIFGLIIALFLALLGAIGLHLRILDIEERIKELEKKNNI